MTQTPIGAIGAHNAKVMNRYALTKRVVDKLKRREAVIGGRQDLSSHVRPQLGDIG